MKCYLLVFIILYFLLQVLAGDENQLRKTASRRCLGPDKQYGWCTHLTKCPLPEFKQDRLRFMDFFCIIDRTYIGVCCPDKFLTQSQYGQALVGNIEFPTQLENIEDGNELLPVTTVKPSTTKLNLVETDIPRQERKGCGLNEKQDLGRVTGGQAADPKAWPWMVAIMKDPAIQFCGGSLITDKHVLTAAHCVFKYKASDLYVRLGEYDFTRFDETRTQTANITQMKIYKDFNPVTYDHDIAILRLQHSMTFNSYVWPACLPQPGMSISNKTAVVIGWGTIEYGGPVSDKLMEVAVPIIDNRDCQKLYIQSISDTNLCAGGRPGEDSCQGDSGGPLLLQLENRRWVSIGIVSWGIKCGDSRPAVYTRVSKYIDWIIHSTAL